MLFGMQKKTVFLFPKKWLLCHIDSASSDPAMAPYDGCLRQFFQKALYLQRFDDHKRFSEIIKN